MQKNDPITNEKFYWICPVSRNIFYLSFPEALSWSLHVSNGQLKLLGKNEKWVKLLYGSK